MISTPDNPLLTKATCPPSTVHTYDKSNRQLSGQETAYNSSLEPQVV